MKNLKNKLAWSWLAAIAITVFILSPGIFALIAFILLTIFSLAQILDS